MSMTLDYQYPRQVEDVTNVKAAVKNFDKEMRRMMLLMKEVGNTLEGVSTSFSALTCLNVQHDKATRQYVDSFREQVVKMKEGAPFQDYNRLVHEEVLGPVNALKTALKETESSMHKRDSSYKSYLKVKEKVDKTERTYAQKSKSLEESKSYPKLKEKREKDLETFHERDAEFQDVFKGFIAKVETVAKSTMHRYLELNAGYMTSVIAALTNTDPSIESHVELYRRQLYADRQSEIAQRKREVEKEVQESFSSRPIGAVPAAGVGGLSSASTPSKQGMANGGGDTPSNGGVVADTPAKPAPGNQESSNGNPNVGGNVRLEDSTARVREELRQGQGVTPAASGPPTAATQTTGADPATRLTGRTAMPPSQSAMPATVGDVGKPSAPAATPAAAAKVRLGQPSPQHADPEAAFDSAAGGGSYYDDGDEDDGGESYFGSVSQVNEAQQLRQQRLQAAELTTSEAPLVAGSGGGKPMYRFAPSTVAGASSVHAGNMEAQENAINERFMQGLEKKTDV